jgi:hypothetical protein
MQVPLFVGRQPGFEPENDVQAHRAVSDPKWRQAEVTKNLWCGFLQEQEEGGTRINHLSVSACVVVSVSLLKLLTPEDGSQEEVQVFASSRIE